MLFVRPFSLPVVNSYHFRNIAGVSQQLAGLHGVSTFVRSV